MEVHERANQRVQELDPDVLEKGNVSRCSVHVTRNGWTRIAAGPLWPLESEVDDGSLAVAQAAVFRYTIAVKTLNDVGEAHRSLGIARNPAGAILTLRPGRRRWSKRLLTPWSR